MKKIFSLLFSFALIIPFIFTSAQAMMEVEKVQEVETVDLEESDDYLEEDLTEVVEVEDATEEMSENIEVDQAIVDELLGSGSGKAVIMIQGRKNNKLAVRYELAVTVEGVSDVSVKNILTEKTDRINIESDKITFDGFIANHFDFFFLKDLVEDASPTMVIKLFSVTQNNRLLKIVVLDRGQKKFKMANGDEYKITITTKEDFIKNLLNELKKAKKVKKIEKVEKELRNEIRPTIKKVQIKKVQIKKARIKKARIKRLEIKNFKEKLHENNNKKDDDFAQMKGQLEEGYKNKLKNLGNTYQSEINKLKAKMHYFGDKGQDVLEKKVDLFDRYDAFRNNDKVKDKFAGFYDQVKDYNFYGEGFDNLKSKLDELKIKMEAGEDVSGDIETLKTKIGELKRKSRVAKFAKAVIPFSDVDDDAWFFTFVKNVKDKGIIKGYSGNKKGQFGPADPVTNAEILKMAVVSGSGSGFDITTYGQAEGYGDHWAANYIAYAQNEGWNFVGDEFAPNRPATRAEVVALLMEQNGFVAEDGVYTESSFSDVEADSVYMSFIELAKELEIISGDSGATTFRPNDPINRAEASKMLHKIMELKELND